MSRSLILFSLLYIVSFSCQDGKGGESCSDGILGDTEYTIDCGGNCPLCDEFFESTWVSKDDNLAPVWKELFSAQSIKTVFNSDKTYQLSIDDSDGMTTAMSGNYSLSDSGIDGIWTIALNQNKPDSKVFEGIIKAQDNYVLKVEIVQTEPYINAIAPTPGGGLGSTKTETGGTTISFPGNVQTFIRQ